MQLLFARSDYFCPTIWNVYTFLMHPASIQQRYLLYYKRASVLLLSSVAWIVISLPTDRGE